MSTGPEQPKPLRDSPADGRPRADRGGVLGRELGGDLPCVVCGYNLRGLSIRAVCPECGTAVRAAILAVVDPHAKAFTPIRHPRLIACGLVTWCLGGVVAAALVWLASFKLIGDPWRLAVVASLAVSGLGSMSLLRPHAGIPPVASAIATVGVVLYVPLTLLIWRLSESAPEPPMAPLGASWTANRPELIDRMAAAATVMAILCCLRPNARLLVTRSLVLRTGRVDRQTIFAMVAAAGTVILGDALLLASGELRGWQQDSILIAGVILRTLGAALLTLGLIGALADSWRIGRAIMAPAPSLAQVVRGDHPPSTGDGAAGGPAR